MYALPLCFCVLQKNGPNVIVPAYLFSLDGLMQVGPMLGSSNSFL